MESSSSNIVKSLCIMLPICKFSGGSIFKQFKMLFDQDSM